MNTKKIILGLFVAALGFTSCSDDEGVNFQPVISDEVTPLGAYENGIIVSNEGNFGQGNASTTYISNDYTTVNNGLFTFHNNTPLGDTAQSIAFNNEFAYIIVNGSNKIEIVNRYTFISVASINTGLSNPRYMTFANGNGYVTNWGDGGDANDDFIAVIDLSNNTISSTISITEGPERIINVNDKLYVSHKGGYSQGNTLSVINTTDSSVSSISVGDVPDEMVVDADNNIWVVCEGIPAWTGNETDGKLLKINTTSNTVVTTIDFATSEHPSKLAIDNEELYYHMGGDVYTMSTTATVLPTNSIISTSSYAMEVRDNKLYITNVDYSNDGVLSVYNLSDNSVISTTTVGISAGGIYFN